jgi:uracil-DNA glycosylase family 4
MDKLVKLNLKMRICKKCPLWKTRKNVVPGEGPVDAKIMIVGQAPGREEDLQGRPFVGRAGKFLNHLLEITQIDRKEIFITSSLKCFPLINRKPTKKEIKTCLPYLKEQIEIINPQKFILLGEVAFKVFFPKERLKKIQGKWVRKDNKEFFAAYHPAAGIRFPKIRKILEKDFRKIKSSINF